MQIMKSLITIVLAIFLITSCKSDILNADQENHNNQTQESVADNSGDISKDKIDIYVEELGEKLTLNSKQIETAKHIERKYYRIRKKLMREKKWAGPANRPERAEFSRAKSEELKRVFGADLAMQIEAGISQLEN